MAKRRVDYVDLLKGFTILWIVWFHCDCFAVMSTPAHVAVFFFLSGMFFTAKPFAKFALSKLNRLAIPFLFFYLLSFPFSIIVWWWDNRTIATFDYGHILDVFKVSSSFEYLFNVPLWFLVCLCSLHFIFYVLHRLPKWMLLIVAVLIILYDDYICSIPMPFMINRAVYWLSFFIFGFVIGRWYLQNVVTLRHRIIAVFAFAVIFIAMKMLPVVDFNVQFHANMLGLILLLLSIFSLLDGNPKLDFLRFYGVNSLTVLGLHYLMVIPPQRLMHKFYPDGNPYWGFVIACVVTLMLYPIIKYMNAKWPFLVGKSDLIKSEARVLSQDVCRLFKENKRQ